MKGAFTCPHCNTENACTCEICKPYIQDDEFLSVWSKCGGFLFCGRCKKMFTPDQSLDAEYKNKIRKIIFLDIDGVLNPMHYMNALFKMWKASGNEIKSKDLYGDLFFDQNCDALKKVVQETGAKIVISSTWRLAGLKTMVGLWVDRGLAGDVIDITPTEREVVISGEAEYEGMVCRGMEIAHWIKTNNFSGNYVIIDDDDDMLPEQQKYFVKTNSFVGLTLKDSEKAIAILNKTN